MNKFEYLKLALGWKCFTRKAWMITAFATIREDATAYQKKSYPGRLVSQPWGYDFVNEEGTLTKVDDSKPNQPLFTFHDQLKIDNSWAKNLQGSVDTTVGNLLMNHIAIISCFDTKIPYLTGPISVPRVEGMIAEVLASLPAPGKPREDGRIYVDEMLKFGEAVVYLKMMAQICTVAATPKGLVPPTGLVAFKKELDEKYAGQLTDPVKLSQYEAELLAFDDEFLKDDPSYGKFTRGKITKTARKKMFLSIGAEPGFDDTNTVIPITTSLVDGWPTDDVKLPSLFNGQRSGSYSRGAETIKGGVSAKYMLRAANNFKILDQDCGSKLGLSRLYDKDNAKNLFGRTLIFGQKQVHIEKDTDLGNYLNNVLTVRSPMYCKLEGDNICKVCAGDNLARYSTGVTIPLTEISAVLLNASLKAMHTSGMSTAVLDINTALS